MSQINSQNGNTLLFTGTFPPCRAATTASVTLAGLQTIDGVALTAGDRVLVWQQADQTLNGIYAASSGYWQRTTDARTNAQYFEGMMVTVAQGTSYGGQIFLCTCTDDPVVIGTSALTFASLTSLNTISTAMKPVVQAATTALARIALGAGLGRYGVDNDGAGYLRPSGPLGTVGGTTGITALNHNGVFVINGATTLNLAASSALWNGFRIKVYTPAGATATVVPDAADTFAGQTIGQSLSVRAGRFCEITTDGAGNWYSTPVSGWQNLPLAITGATTVSNTHDGLTLQIGGGSFYDLQFPSGSTLHPNFTCVIGNTETSQIGHGIGGTGGIPNFTLYPGESYLVYNDSGTLRLLGGAVKRYKQSNIALFVDGTNGSDNPLVSDGLATGVRAFKTIRAALNALYQNFDHNNSFPTITIAPGVYNESLTVQGPLTGSTVFFINGASPVVFDPTTHAFVSGVLWQPANSSTPYCITVADSGTVEVSNIFLNGGGISSIGVQMHQTSILDWNGGGGFGSMGTGNHVGTDGCGASFNINAGYTVSGSGGATNHFAANSPSIVTHYGGITVTLGTGAAQPNIGTWFNATSSQISLGASITWVNPPLSGTKWAVGPGAVLSLSGNATRVPGSTAGSPVVNVAPGAATGWVIA